GAYLSVINSHGKEVDPDYRSYSGITRNILRLISDIQLRQEFQIDWDSDNSRVYLASHESLIMKLRLHPKVLTDSGQLISFSSHAAKLLMAVEENAKKKLSGKLRLLLGEGESPEVRFLSDSLVLSGTTVYEIPSAGERFADLAMFESAFQANELENFLSLFYSHFADIPIRYQDYQCVEGPTRLAQAALVFEKIDHEQNLYLRVSTTVEGLDADFFEEYEINRLVTLNEMERVIQICPLVEESSVDALREINSLLNKRKRQLKTDDADFYLEENLFIIQKTLAQEFIYLDLPNLIGRYSLLGSEKLKDYKVRAVTPRLSLALAHGIDFLEGEATLEIEGQSFSLFEAISLYRKKSYIPLTDGTHALINQGYIEKLERLFKKQQDQVKVSFFDLPAIEELIDEKAAQATFPQSREIFRGFNELKDQKIKLPTVKATLRPYQQQGYKWLEYLRKNNLGGCLADDMGLGKTIQTLTMLAGVYPKEKMPSLLVMPKSLLFNWQKEIEKFTPNITCYVFYGNDRDMAKAKEHNLILTTYAMLRNQIEQFCEEQFYYVVLDESQNIKNIQSQISKAVLLLKAQHRLALSGTPVENNLGELYSLFRFLNPAMFNSADEFNRYYIAPIQQNNDKQAIHELKTKIYPFILRRLKKDVLKELPDKIEQVLYVDMSDEQKRLYHQRRVFYQDSLKQQIAVNGINKSQFFIFQALTELRQIASIPEAQSDGAIVSPKRELLLEQIMESTANRHKVLVFGNFLSILEHVGEDLQQAGIQYLVMTGATQDRGALVERFQNDPDCQVFLMTLKTGGLGLNLTKADTIFIFDPWWNLAAENQAIDRSHRIGQDKTVFSYKLITRGSIEEKILQLQEKKRELFENIISSDSASIKSLNEEDINFILS
ncbi:MAG: DEAD/DEAH box helicase, partial [SAR324 cluster bacterium]|nr:DEAD/DEAH box helicase [SAR324 cluster bacterium]